MLCIAKKTLHCKIVSMRALKIPKLFLGLSGKRDWVAYGTASFLFPIASKYNQGCSVKSQRNPCQFANRIQKIILSNS